jgi:hypothetical protein
MFVVLAIMGFGGLLIGRFLNLDTRPREAVWVCFGLGLLLLFAPFTKRERDD